MRHKVDSLLVPGFIAFGGEHAPAHNEVLIGRRRRHREHGREERLREWKHRAMGEADIWRESRTGNYRNTCRICLPTWEQGESYSR